MRPCAGGIDGRRAALERNQQGALWRAFHLRLGLGLPVCSAIIRSRRAEEVRQAVEAHGAEQTLMLSLTVRHGLGHRLKVVRKGVAQAFRRLARGAPWKRFMHDYGLDGSIRGLDLTHGPVNGWHPHIHALLFFDAPLTEVQLREARHWLAERWAACVARELGEEHRPDLEHGTDLRAGRIAEYLTKFGLELTSPGRSKRGRGDQRTPMQIAYDFAERRDVRDAELWRDYGDAMFGAKMLTWSRGLRKRLGLGKEATDEELGRAEGCGRGGVAHRGALSGMSFAMCPVGGRGCSKQPRASW